jgi:hypothetical protein
MTDEQKPELAQEPVASAAPEAMSAPVASEVQPLAQNQGIHYKMFLIKLLKGQKPKKQPHPTKANQEH